MSKWLVPAFHVQIAGARTRTPVFETELKINWKKQVGFPHENKEGSDVLTCFRIIIFYHDHATLKREKSHDLQKSYAII